MGKRAVNLLRKMSGDFVVQNANFQEAKNKVIAVSAAKTLTNSDSGATIYWTHSASNHDITLPAAKVGLNFKFVIAVGHAAVHEILCAGSDEVFGKVTVTSKTANKTDTQSVAKGAGDTTISLHESTVTLGGDYGDVIDLVCVEDGYWLCSAMLHINTGDPEATAVLN
tara:strand:- start:893 stop:1396 length:504 start_codon:yes stop_codon:yes gene_type:complete